MCDHFLHDGCVEIFLAKMGSWVEPSGSGGGATQLSVGGFWRSTTQNPNQKSGSVEVLGATKSELRKVTDLLQKWVGRFGFDPTKSQLSTFGNILSYTSNGFTKRRSLN
jgi:hypothetical protein